ncbi:uncharacterized protein TM35_000551020, partial [Trypanosoma theileri]
VKLLLVKVLLLVKEVNRVVLVLVLLLVLMVIQLILIVPKIQHYQRVRLKRKRLLGVHKVKMLLVVLVHQVKGLLVKPIALVLKLTRKFRALEENKRLLHVLILLVDLRHLQVHLTLESAATVKEVEVKHHNLHLLLTVQPQRVMLVLILHRVNLIIHLQGVSQQATSKVWEIQIQLPPQPLPPQHFLLNSQTTRRVMQTAAAVSAVLCGCVYHY